MRAFTDPPQICNALRRCRDCKWRLGCPTLIAGPRQGGELGVTKYDYSVPPVPFVVNALSSAEHRTAAPSRDYRNASYRTSGGDGSCWCPEKTTRKLSRNTPAHSPTDPKQADRPPNAQSAKARYRNQSDRRTATRSRPSPELTA